jgi:hypothetical protein
VSRQTTEMRISDVLIASALMPALDSASKNVAVTPGWDFMPAPTSETLPMCSSDSSCSKPTCACVLASAAIASGRSLLGSVKEMSVRSVAPDTFCTIMSMLTSASATARKMLAASPGLSGTPTTVTRASDRSCATPLMMAASTSGSWVISVPGLLENDDRTTSGTEYRRAYSTQRRCRILAPDAASSSISSYETVGRNRAFGTMRGSAL